MHVAISSLPITNTHSDRGTGIYTKELIAAFKNYEPQHSYTLFTQAKDIPVDADIVHYPYFDPFFLTLPWKKTHPTLVTVHDLIPLVFPDKFPKGVRGAVKWQMQKALLKSVDGIITDSKNSKGDIERLVGFDPSKIYPIYLAPSSLYDRVPAKEAIVAVRKKYGLTGAFLLYVGDVNWNKNIPGLIKATASIAVPLVLVGKAFLDSSLPETKEINNIILNLGRQDFIIRPGFVPDGDLVCLYETATCLVAPSYYEGFGLPVLEAFASGCPVVVSDNSSLSEIAGPAIRVDAKSIESITNGIQTVVEFSKEKRAQLIDRGHAWVKQFSWKNVACQTVAVYEKVLG